jgi:hypothetical protein
MISVPDLVLMSKDERELAVQWHGSGSAFLAPMRGCEFVEAALFCGAAARITTA